MKKSDIEEIRKIVREEVGAVFIRKALMEFVPQKPGDPPKHTKELEIDILEELVKYLPRLEGAIRGCQADSNVARNRAVEVRNLLHYALRERQHNQDPSLGQRHEQQLMDG